MKFRGMIAAGGLLASATALADVTTIVTPEGAATMTITEGSNAAVSCDGGSLAVNGAAVLPATACAAVTSIEVLGDAAGNRIDLNGVLAPAFDAMPVTVRAGDGADRIIGSAFDDIIVGGGGDDTVSGRGGNDQLVWAVGDGRDNLDGGDNASDRDTVEIVGTPSREVVRANLAPSAPGLDPLLQLTVDDVLAVSSTDAERVFVDLAAGDDEFDATGTGFGALGLAFEVRGGDGDDDLFGTDAADELQGGAGDDELRGRKNPGGTLDRLLGDDGSDTIVWSPGDGSDVNDGGDGQGVDTIVVEGNADETFLIASTATGVLFRRTLPDSTPFSIDIERAEKLRLDAGAGRDVVDASALTGTSIALEVNGGAGDDDITGGAGADVLRGDDGADTLVGRGNPAATFDVVEGGAGDDTIIWRPGHGSDVNEGGLGEDVVIVEGADAVNGNSGDETYTVGVHPTDASRVLLRRSLPGVFEVDIGSAETLRLDTKGGVDQIDADALPAGFLSFEVLAGDGNDIVRGSQDADVLKGNAGNDTLFGNGNPGGTQEIVLGGDGDDRLVWEPGDGTDFNAGGPGRDFVAVTGGPGGETFNVSVTANGASIERSVPTTNTFKVDFEEAEVLELDAGPGADTVNTQFVVGLEQQLDGNAPDVGDALFVQDVDNVRPSPLERAGFGSIFHVNFDFAAAGGTIEGRVFDDLDADGVFDGFERALANVTVFDDVDRDRILDAGERATLSDADGRYALRFEDDTTAHVRAMLPTASALHTGLDPDALDVRGDVEWSNIDFGFEDRAAGTITLTSALEDADGRSASGGRAFVSLVPGAATAQARFEYTRLPADAARIELRLDDAVLLAHDVLEPGTAGATRPIPFAIDDVQAERLRAGEAVVAIHVVGGGEPAIAGVLLEDAVFEAALAGTQVVPPVATTAAGKATVTLAGPGDRATVRVRYEGLLGIGGTGRSIAAAVMGPASRGDAGPERHPLRGSGSHFDAFVAPEYAVDPTEVAELVDGLQYVEVRSVEFPHGEIRGQLDDALFRDGFE